MPIYSIWAHIYSTEELNERDLHKRDRGLSCPDHDYKPFLGTCSYA